MVDLKSQGRELSARRRLGRSTVSAPPLGFGGAALGNLYAAVAEETAAAAVHEALARDIGFFDTAPLYGYGLSEERLGRALRGVERDAFVISTKVGRVIEACDRRSADEHDMFAVRSDRRAVFDYTRAGVMRSFEGSLRRLGLNGVDVLLLHDVGRMTHGARHEEVLRLALREALPAMAELKAGGACRAIGLAVNEEAVCLEILPHADLDCIMLAGRYTLLEQGCLSGILLQAQLRSVAVLAAAPFNSGLLADSRAPGRTYNYGAADDAVLHRARRIYEAAAAEGADVSAAALQFPLAHPAVACVVAGLRSPLEVLSAAQRMSQPAPPALWERLRREKLLDETAPVPGAAQR